MAAVLLAGQYNSGHAAVLGFFAISGFLITASWQKRKSAGQFLKNRIARIHPGYLVAVTLCSLVVVPLYSSRSFGSLSLHEIGGLLSNVLLQSFIIQSNAFGGGPVNGSLWSIRYEFWCYLGVMALGLMGSMRWRGMYPAIAVTVMAVRVFLDLTGRHPNVGLLSPFIGYAYFWFDVLPPFMLGGCAYLYRDRIPRSGVMVMIASVLVVASAHLPVAQVYRDTLTHTLFPPVFCYALFYLVFDTRVPKFETSKFGDMSYGTYLYAFPIQQMLASSLRGVVAFPVYVVLSIVLSLAAGWASWHVIEKHFHRARAHVSASDAATVATGQVQSLAQTGRALRTVKGGWAIFGRG
ncbi:MAG: acyltransferase [Oxalobacteraceae bacterium]|nr:MAG: acyltransferase [Oxalobacteraceae bacterium]